MAVLPAAYTRRVLFNNMRCDEEEHEYVPRRHSAPRKLILKSTGHMHMGDSSTVESDDSGSHDESPANESPESPTTDSHESPTRDASTAPRKYLGLSADELMALDPQFAQPKHKISDFRFDLVQTYYLPARRGLALLPLVPKVGVSYPLLNEHNYRSLLLTVKHESYDCAPSSRTLLLVVSGRRHTWNLLDWLCLNSEGAKAQAPFLAHGDHLVVAARVPQRALAGPRRRQEERLHERCSRFLRYIVQNLPPLKLKVTVEFVPEPGGTRAMLRHVFAQYQPTLVVLGNKLTNLNFRYTAPGRERDRLLVKLSLYLIRYATVPVVVVGNGTIYHVPRGRLVTFEAPRKDSQGLIELYLGLAWRGTDISGDIAGLLALDAVLRFADMARCVSLASLAQLRLYLLLEEPYLNEVVASKVHQAHVFGKSAGRSLLLGPYRVKSLIAEEKEKGLVNDKKLKKTLSTSSSLASTTSDEKVKRSFFGKLKGWGRRKS